MGKDYSEQANGTAGVYSRLRQGNWIYECPGADLIQISAIRVQEFRDQTDFLNTSTSWPRNTVQSYSRPESTFAERSPNVFVNRIAVSVELRSVEPGIPEPCLGQPPNPAEASGSRLRRLRSSGLERICVPRMSLSERKFNVLLKTQREPPILPPVFCSTASLSPTSRALSSVG